MFPLWPFSVTREVSNISVYIYGKRDLFENLFTRWSFENACTLFWRIETWYSSWWHNWFWNKTWKIIYKSKIDFLGSTNIQYYLKKFIILDNTENLGAYFVFTALIWRQQIYARKIYKVSHAQLCVSLWEGVVIMGGKFN